MTVYQVDNAWLADVDVNGRRIRRRCASKADAERLERDLKRALLQEHYGEEERTGTMQWLHRQCVLMDWSSSPSSVERSARVVGWFGKQTEPSAITAQAIDEWVADQRQQGKANSTIRLYLSALRVMLHRAQRLGLIEVMPLLPEPRTLALPEPRDLVLEPHWVDLQVAAMRRMAAPPPESITSRARRTESQRAKVAAMAELTLFLRYMGCRVNEALSLTWDNLDSRGNVQFILTKGKRARRLPMFPEAAAAVTARRKAGADRPFAICYDTYLSIHYETRDLVCDALSLSDYVRQNWVIHTLRHTRLTELAQMGWSSAQIKEWAGHSSLLVSEKYIHGSAIRFPIGN